MIDRMQSRDSERSALETEVRTLQDRQDGLLDRLDHIRSSAFVSRSRRTHSQVRRF